MVLALLTQLLVWIKIMANESFGFTHFRSLRQRILKKPIQANHQAEVMLVYLDLVRKYKCHYVYIIFFPVLSYQDLRPGDVSGKRNLWEKQSVDKVTSPTKVIYSKDLYVIGSSRLPRLCMSEPSEKYLGLREPFLDDHQCLMTCAEVWKRSIHHVTQSNPRRDFFQQDTLWTLSSMWTLTASRRLQGIARIYVCLQVAGLHLHHLKLT